MKKSEFRLEIKNLLSTNVQGLTLDEKRGLISQCFVDVEQSSQFDESNKGKPWSDDELRAVLTLAPTKTNCMKLARAFKRGYGSIEQIYRWAASTKEEVSAKRPNDTFIKQVKRVAKEVGWRAT